MKYVLPDGRRIGRIRFWWSGLKPQTTGAICGLLMSAGWVIAFALFMYFTENIQ